MAWPHFSRSFVHGPGLRIEAGRSTKDPTHTWGPQGRDLGMHGLLLLVSGSGAYRDSEGRRARVTAGDLILLFPGLRHDYGPGPGETWHEAFLDAAGPLPGLLESQGVLDRRRPLHRPDPSVAQLLLQFIAEIENGRLHDPRRAQLRLHGMLLALAGDEDDDGLERGRRTLVAALERKLDPRAAADAAGMGWELFRKRFRTRYGLPPARYRVHARCAAAAGMLLEPHMTEDAVADRLGFCDAAHLRRQMRSALGMSAAQFRRLHGGVRC